MAPSPWTVLIRVLADMVLFGMPFACFLLGAWWQRRSDQQRVHALIDHFHNHLEDLDDSEFAHEMYEHARGIPRPHGYNPDLN